MGMGRDTPDHRLSTGFPMEPGRTLRGAEGAPPDHAAAFHAAADGLALLGLDGHLREVNAAFCDLFGLTAPEAVGLSLDDLVEPRAAQTLAGRLALLARGQMRTFRCDCQIRHRQAPAAWCALSAAAIRDGVGRPSGAIIQVRDISEAKQVERMMLASDRRFRTIFNSLSEGFVEIDTRGRIVDVNDPLCGMLGLGREDLIGHPVARFLDDNSHAIVFADDHDAADGPYHHAYEVGLVGKGGCRVEAQVFATMLTDQDGVRTGATAIILDVTEHKRAQVALQASEQRYRTLVDSIQDGLILVCDGRFEYVNAPFADMLDRTVGQVVGHTVNTVVPPEHRGVLAASAVPMVDGSPRTAEHEMELMAADGRRVSVTVHAAATRDGDGRLLVIATVKDVTARRRIEADLRKLSWAVEHSATGVFITDVNGIIEYVNRRFTDVTGYTAEEAVGRTPALLKSGETDPTVYRDMWRALTSGRDWRGEIRNRRKDGTLYWEYTSISPVRGNDGAITHFVAVKEDVTGRKEAELLNWQRAYFDQVTGLPNRVLFKDRLTQALVRARREKSRVAVMFIDLDRFKAVNDTLGHETGDAVLKQVAERLADCMRDSDTVARLGGDEFTAILPNPGPEKAITVIATRILESLRRPFDIEGGHRAFIGGSIGISLFPGDGDAADALLKNADQAMYRAKETGRNTYQFFTADMNVATQARLRTEGDLRHALQNHQFAVHFQPMVDAGSRRIVGTEALVRWAHPLRGLVSPGEFLPVAEDIGLIGELGANVLRTACEHCHRWRESGHPDLTISVNISGRQIGAPDFLDVVAGALHDSSLPPSALDLEISENLLMADVPVIESHLRRLADSGVRLTIDDFGTGLSSIPHLRRFPFHSLKVDRSFVMDVLENKEDAILVEAVIAMARKLGLSVVAEGVETEDQIDYLLTQYCDMFQGFLFGRPLPAEEFERLLG
jgi:diguanylate cyclase (GGDEF)-like protein/PAS domain S-box-containing protein